MRNMIKETVLKVFGEEVKELGKLTGEGTFDITLEFTDEVEYVGRCNYMARKDLFGNIVEVGELKGISISISGIQLVLKSNFAPWLRTKATEAVVRHTVRHELRHAYQVLFNKQVLMESNYGLLGEMNGYGEIPAEKDANSYAEEYNYTSNFEKTVFELMTMNQDIASKMCVEKADQQRVKAMYKQLIKYTAMPFLA